MRPTARLYAVRYTRNGSYSLTGRPCIVRTFATAADRDAWLAEERPTTSVLYDGKREPVVPWTLVAERSTQKAIAIVEAVPGI